MMEIKKYFLLALTTPFLKSLFYRSKGALKFFNYIITFLFLISPNHVNSQQNLLSDTLIQIVDEQPVNSTSDKNLYTILISFDGLRYDFFGQSSLLKNFKYIEDNGVVAKSLKPVFPTTTLPNHYTMLTGMEPINHGIIANSFKDPFYNEYFSSNAKGSRKLTKWYMAESIWETAKRQAVKTGACYWTSADIEDKIKNPDFFIDFDGMIPYFARIDSGISWLENEISNRPKLIAYYFEEVDVQAHFKGTKTQELTNSLMIVDSIVGYFMEKLKKINVFDRTNIILVSDHGTMDFDSSNVIYIDSILAGIRFELQNYGAFMMIDANENVLNEIYDSLKLHAVNYDVYFKDEIPESLNFSKHPYISPILVLAKPGWILIDRNSDEKSKKIKAIHGYNNNLPDMHGIFYAMGPSFKKNYKTETINNIDIYPLLCRILGIMPRNNIDGKLERIKFILKETK